MPFYDYKCAKCGHVFEVIHGMNEKPDVSCDACGAKNAQRVFNGFGMLGGASDGGHSHGCSSCATGGCSTCNCH